MLTTCAALARDPAPQTPAGVKVPAAKPPGPPPIVWHALPDGSRISAESAILMDAATGRVLWEHASHRRMYPASLTKMMTGLLAIESGRLDQVYQASKLAASTGESSIALKEGERLKLRDVLAGSLIKSANDATVMLAESVGGTLPQFIQMMNDRAATLGLTGTHFGNPHGLHQADHYSTAADQCAIARAAMKNPVFARLVATRETVIPWPGKPWMRKLPNRNRLLFRWDQCDGIKTGYTKQAGRCLAASATENDWRLICVVLKSHDSWADSKTLLEWGFRSFIHQPVVLKSSLYRVPVSRGVSREVLARPERSVYVVLTAGENVPEAVQSRKPAVAPIALGGRVGTLTVGTGQATQTVRLVAVSAVAESFWARMWDRGLPQALLGLLVLASAGVLMYGASAKAARARRRRLAARKRKTYQPGSSDDQRAAS